VAQAIGFLVTAMCLARDVKGGMIYGIVFLTALSWIISRGISTTVFPDTLVGDADFSYFKKIVDFHRIEGTTE
jgi:AGZA family xanthine/uracil permease-like MFS transporter